MSGIMAAHLGIISLTVWALLQHTTWACSVSCSNDYISSLNCTCVEEVPSYPYTFAVECWDEVDYTNSNCSIEAPNRWCILKLDSEFVIAADTECKIRGISTKDEWTIEEYNSVHISLTKHVKPQSPFNLTFTQNDQNVTISWEMVYTSMKNYYLNNHLMYRVRIRAKDGPQKDPVKEYTISEDRRYLEIMVSTLEGGKTYLVDVQARPNSYSFTAGYWSEWSSAIEVQIEDASEEVDSGNDTNGQSKKWLYMLILFSLLFLLFLLFQYGRKAWQHKMQLCSYIPTPEDYFKPLYHIYGGDFTKWVGPAFVFGEYDFMEKNMVLPVVNGKPANPIPNCENKERSAGCSLKNSLLGIMSGHNSSTRLSFLNGGSDSSSGSQATQSSQGGISIDTVMVLEEEEGTGPGGSWDSYKGVFAYPAYRLGENSGCEVKALLGAEPRNEVVISSGRVSNDGRIPRGLSTPLGLYDLEWGMAEQASELERLSLDSFSSAERSEDGYPNVVLDLDTIDSGFLESDCSSPVRSDFGDKEETEVPHSHSNYVKQWVTNPEVDTDTSPVN